MARTQDRDSVGSQFFIVLDDKDRGILADANTYQIIGTVTTGMESVDAIYAAAGGQEPRQPRRHGQDHRQHPVAAQLSGGHA